MLIIGSLARGFRRGDASTRRTQMMWRGRAAQDWELDDPEQRIFPNLFAFQNAPAEVRTGYNDSAEDLMEGNTNNPNVNDMLQFTTALLQHANIMDTGNSDFNQIRQDAFVRVFEESLNIFNIDANESSISHISERVNFPRAVGDFTSNVNTIANLYTELKKDPILEALPALVCEPFISGAQNSSDVGPASRELALMEQRDELRPNAEQLMLLRRAATYLDAIFRNDRNTVAPLIFLTGAAGTGKSFLFTCIEILTNAIGKRIAPTALTGVACTAISTTAAARTTQYFFHLGWGHGSIPLKDTRLNNVRNLLRDVVFVIVDEISFMLSQDLAFINNRLKQVMGNELDFGGLGVILSGDFYQIPPPKAMPLYKEVLRLSPPPATTSTGMLDDIDSNWNTRGARLFTKFRRIELTENRRSLSDPELTRLTTNFRNGISDGLVEYLQNHLLTSADVDTFRNAPIISPGNPERHHSNLNLLSNFARQHGDRVISWRSSASFPGSNRNVADTIRSMSNSENVTRAYQLNPQLMQHFVAGAPIINKTNTNPLRGIANGTRGFAYALEWTSDIRNFALDYIREHAGNIILPPGLEPTSFLYRPSLKQEFIDAWPLDLTLVPEDIILSIPKKKSNIFLKSGAQSIVASVEEFEYQLAFVATTHSMQGQTISPVILSFLERPGKPSRNEWAPAYVGLTRAVNGNNLRIIGQRNDLDFITQMQPPPELISFNNRYNTDGEWTYGNQDGLSQTRAGEHTVINREGRAGSNRGRTAGNRGADRGRGASSNSARTGQVRDAETSAASSILNQDGVSQTRAGGHALANRGGGRAGSNRGRTAGSRRGRFSSASSRGGQESSATAGGGHDSRNGGLSASLKLDFVADNSAEQRLSNVSTFSDFYCPILRDIFCEETITSDSFRVQLRILEHYWNPEVEHTLRDYILIVRQAYQLTPFYDDIRLVVEPQVQHIDAYTQENLFLFFRDTRNEVLNPLMNNLRQYSLDFANREIILIIRDFSHQLDYAIARFQNDYKALGVRVFT